MNDTTVIIAISALVLGVVGGFILQVRRGRQIVRSTEKQSDRLLKEAQERSSALLGEARREAEEALSRQKEEVLIQTEQLKRLEERIRGKEELIRRRMQSVESKQHAIISFETDLERIREEISASRLREIEELSKACGVPVEHATESVLQQITEELEHDKLERLHRVTAFLEEGAEDKAKSIVLNAIQKYSLPASRESHSMYIDITNKKVQQKIFGDGPQTVEENPNILRLKQLTGVECEIDEDTHVLLIHQYDLLKRSVAKMALDEILKRRHPAIPRDIDEAVERAGRKIHTTMDELGRKTLQDLNITDFGPRMVRLVGRLAYRTSFGQNILAHSTEVSCFSALLAAEIGANIQLCKRAGLIHDLGKGIDADVDGPHDVLSRDIGTKLDLDEHVIHAAYAHHEQIEYVTPEDILVQVADAISASRPGARQEATEQYIERIQALEMLASSFAGVSKAYAIQAGREVRVVVEPEEVSDEDAARIAKEIAATIESKLTYPGEVMVHVIRETSAADYAR